METMVVGDLVDDMSCGLGEQCRVPGMRDASLQSVPPTLAQAPPFYSSESRFTFVPSLWVLPSGIVKKVLRSVINALLF